MANENETIADIVADFRQYVANTKIPPEVAETIVCYLDRIEAAWRREKAEAEAAALSAGGIVEASRHKPGSAAALREALVKIREYIITGNTGYEPKELLELILNWCDSSLTAPPRNCDKMPDIDNLTMHDLAKSPCKSTLEYASRDELLALVRWLLAPAAKRKGETDGR